MCSLMMISDMLSKHVGAVKSVLKKWFKINDIQLVHLLVVWYLVNLQEAQRNNKDNFRLFAINVAIFWLRRLSEQSVLGSLVIHLRSSRSPDILNLALHRFSTPRNYLLVVFYKYVLCSAQFFQTTVSLPFGFFVTRSTRADTNDDWANWPRADDGNTTSVVLIPP